MTAAAARVHAHAKINVRLKVLSLETGGFHGLETVFVKLSLADILTVRIIDGARRLHVTGEPDLAEAIGPAELNLAFRAATSYAEITGWPSGFEIDLEKRIPVAAGLGGGSADAAAVLRALNALAPVPAAERDLLRIAASLGADVPFLATDHVAALAWRRGDRMLALPPLPEREITLLTPTFAVATADAYRWLDATRAEQEPPPESFPLDAFGDWESIVPYAENDFEVPVIAQHPAIAQMLASLAGAGAMIARMSGSGSTVFGVFAGAAPSAAALGAEAWEVRVTRNLQQVVRPELRE